MSECINNYFILNGEAIESSAFDDSIVRQGKTLYEVIRIINGVPLFVEKHLSRLRHSAAITGLTIDYNDEEICHMMLRLIEANKMPYGNIKLAFNYAKENRAAAYFIEHHYPSELDYIDGVDTIFYHGERTNPNAKVINLNFRQAVDYEIKKANAYEAILVDRNGIITEGSRSNIFMVKDGKVLTSPIELVLPGVTRDAIIETCSSIGLEVLEQKVNFNDIDKLDALFISGTSPKVLPIRKVGMLPFNSSHNTIVKDIMSAYCKNIENYVKSHMVKC